MLKKLLYLFIILLVTMLFANICFATEIVTNLNNTINANDIQATDNVSLTDNTIYSATTDDQIAGNLVTDYEEAATTTTTDYESETELSISNMINIVLIVVGVVLVLLGIAIIIKLK